MQNRLSRQRLAGLDVVSLLSWYRKNRRDLPWRKTRDPYRIWLSEVLLQQTRVEQALPYYRRFLEKFPSLEDLADAPVDDVLKAWEGAGYYARARNLHAAAKKALERFGGLPKTHDEWLSLPGVGPYTAAAVSSIAFGESRAVLDGNVARVLSRILALKKPIALPSSRSALLYFAQHNLPADSPSDYNQALMEVGATVCLPKKPNCVGCPLKKSCRAFALKKQEEYPVKQKKAKLPHFDIACAVVRKGGKILICKRRANGLLGGLWEFPGGKVQSGESFQKAAVREVREETGLRVKAGQKIATVQHAYSHFRITLHAFEATWVSANARALGCDKVAWVNPDELERFAFPKANRAVLKRLRFNDST